MPLFYNLLLYLKNIFGQIYPNQLGRTPTTINLCKTTQGSTLVEVTAKADISSGSKLSYVTDSVKLTTSLFLGKGFWQTYLLTPLSGGPPHVPQRSFEKFYTGIKGNDSLEININRP